VLNYVVNSLVNHGVNLQEKQKGIVNWIALERTELDYNIGINYGLHRNACLLTQRIEVVE